MKVRFRGAHTTVEAAESIDSILKLFQERYGIDSFEDMTIEMTLLDNGGEIVEIVDANTAEIYDTFDVYKSEEIKKPHLRLVVDNTVH